MSMRNFIATMALSIACFISAGAQSTFQKAVSHFSKANTATASVTVNRVNKALKNKVTETGTMWMKSPDKVSISSKNGKNKLIMNGTTFTMKMNGFKHTTSSKTNAQFATFYSVFKAVLNGGKTDVDQLPGVSVSQKGTTVVVTIVPKTADAKKQKRMMFTSFVLEVNSRTSALESLRINQRNGSYTLYTFSAFKFNTSVADTVFKP